LISGSLVVGFAAWFAIEHVYPLSSALLLGACGLAIIVIWGLRAPQILGKREREELEKRAHIDLPAARQLQKLLKQDLKGEALMRGNLDKMAPPEMRESAVRMIEQRENDLQARLVEVQATIQQLQG